MQNKKLFAHYKNVLDTTDQQQFFQERLPYLFDLADSTSSVTVSADIPAFLDLILLTVSRNGFDVFSEMEISLNSASSSRSFFAFGFSIFILIDDILKYKIFM